MAPGECAVQVPEAPIRRLSRIEYDNTLRDLGLLAAGKRLAVDSFSADSVIGGAHRGFSIGGPVDNSLARDLVDAAMSTATTLVTDLPKLLGCTPASAAAEDTCARAFFTSFGRRAFRRPLAPAEVDEIQQVFTSSRTAFDFRTGIEVALATILAAPEFVYLFDGVARGAPAGSLVPVDGFALASRLSYFLWDSTPDAPLLAAAESGALGAEKTLEAEVRRMFDDPRARGAVNHFFREWSFIEELEHAPKDITKFAFFTPELRAALADSFLASLEQAFWSPGATLSGLLGSDTTFVNTGIARAYGMTPVTSTKLVEAKLDPAQRRGPLTHPAFLAMTAKPSRGDPIHRGLFVRRQILCTQLPDPPEKDANGNPINFNVPPPEPGVTNRDRFKQHTESPSCSGCHNMIDSIGFGFENYDATGRFRTVDENRDPVDARGEVVSGGDLSGPFTGALELVARAVKSEAVAGCMELQWFRFALGRPEGPADTCSNSKVVKRFAKAGGTFKELIVALALGDAFRYRKVLTGEGGAR